MDLWDRFLWLAIGGFFGFVLGYIVRSLQDIRDKVEHVEETVSDIDSHNSKWEQRDDGGFMRNPIVADVMVLLVVGLSVFASFSTAKVNSDMQQLLDCSTEYNYRQGVALRGRDSAIRAGTDSEINLWEKYERLYKQAKKDPKKIPVLQDRLNKALINHRKTLEDLQETREQYSYASPNVLQECEGETK